MSHHPPSDPIPAELFLDLVQEEIEKSRESFPSNEHKLAALQEEVGELAEALIEHDAGSLSFEAVTMEAVQAAGSFSSPNHNSTSFAMSDSEPETDTVEIKLVGGPRDGETIEVHARTVEHQQAVWDGRDGQYFHHETLGNRDAPYYVPTREKPEVLHVLNRGDSDG